MREHTELNQTFVYKGFTFIERHYADVDHEPPVSPWSEMQDGSDIVSGWVSRDDRQGRLLVQMGAYKVRYYDMDESRRLMLKSMSEEGADAALQADFEYIRGWHNDEWHYIGIQVCLQQLPTECESLWGIESHAEAPYHQKTREELADQLLQSLPKWIDREIERLETLKRQLEADAYRDADEIIRDRREWER